MLAVMLPAAVGALLGTGLGYFGIFVPRAGAALEDSAGNGVIYLLQPFSFTSALRRASSLR